MKQYVVTEAEFELLLKTLELHKFKGSPYLHSNIAIRAKQLIKDKGLSLMSNELTAVPELEKLMLDEAHSTFHYYVTNWILDVKK